MKLDKAIEILNLWSEDTEEVEEEDFSDAIQLGIGALKRLRSQRKFKLSYHLKLLPGETEEGDND